MNKSLPVIVGVGQVVDRESGSTDLSPLSLALEASKRALTDSGVTGVAAHIDTLVFVRINSDSIPGHDGPFGRCDNLPAAVAQRLGAAPERHIYSAVGGQTPQQLVNELGAQIASGDITMALLTGAEAIAAMKRAQRGGQTLDWSLTVDAALDDRGFGPELITPDEIAGGMGNPPQVYATFEHAWRAARGHTLDEQHAHMARLFAPFSQVASDNPYAQFPVRRSEEFLSTESDDNYRIADPYLKWHVAQDAVNQGAAVLLTSVGKAEALGIPREHWVFPQGGADTMDKLVSRRPRLDASIAMQAAGEAALAQAGVDMAAIDHLDLYSCFPCAVQFACDALGIDAASRTLTQTGGLPFFGGAGNNYSMHAIASMVETLRNDPGSLGLVLANGGFLSKESVGVYGTQPNPAWQPVDNRAAQLRIDSQPDVPQASAPASGEMSGVIESYSVLFVKREPLFGYVFARNDEGRFLARTDSRDVEAAMRLLDGDSIGREIRVEATPKRNRLLL